MMSVLLYLQQTPVDTWESLRGGLLGFISTACILLLGGGWKLYNAVTKLTHIVVGADGKNGLRSAVEGMDGRLKGVEAWKRDLLAVAKYEREHYDGPERRAQNRRLRDQRFPNPLDAGEGPEDES